MQLSFGLVAAAALSVVEAVIITNSGTSFIAVQAGNTLPITWSDANGPVTLTLKTGPAAALTTVFTIQSGLTGSSYSWAIPSNLKDGAYALQIDDSTGVPNYSIVFPIAGGSYHVSSVAPSSATPTPSSSPVPSSSSSSSSASVSTPAGYSTAPPPNPSSTPIGYSNSSSSAKPSHGGSSKTPLPSGSASPSAPPNSNSGASFASPLAFVLLAFAALFTLN